MDASLQLWSLRGPIADRGIADVVRQVAQAGWHRVEPFALLQTVDEVEAVVQQSGLSVPTVHAEFRTHDLGAVFAAADRLGARRVVQAMFPAQCWTDAAAVRQTALVLQRAAKVGRDHGVRVGIHHHDDELRTQVDGQPALFRLVDELEGLGDDPDAGIGIQVDVNWAALAGFDPARLVRRLGPRVLSAHVKDGPGLGVNAEQTALGRGRLDVAGFLAALPADAPVVVSLDAYGGEPFEAVEASRVWLQERGIE